ncbi:MAG: ABC transporter ATP-binding protein [Planctomycetales bacterium]|nr:ABC transporter ATP-binding protein [Planctomycetales bacterium]
MADSLVEMLDLACRGMGQPFDRGAARRQLATSLAAEQTTSASGAGESLVGLAACWNLRADLVVVEPAAAASLFRPGAPMALLRDNPEGGVDWLLLSDYRANKVAISTSGDPGSVRWVTPAELATLVGSNGATASWLSLERMLPCESNHAEGGKPLTPLSRLLQLLKPERSDIAVVVVFAIVVGLLTLSTPIAVEALVNTVAFGRMLQPVVVLASLLFVFLGFSAALRGLQTYIAEIVQQRLFVRVSSDLAHRLPLVRTEFWDGHYGPELVNRFFDVVTVQKVISQLLLDGVSLVLQTLVGMTVIAFYHPVLLGFDAFLLVLVIAIVFVLGRGSVSSAIDESLWKYRTAAWLEELARHPTSFRATNEFRFALDVADRQVTGYLQARRRHFRILMRQIVAALGLQALASTVLLGLGGWLVIRGELTLGQLVAAELIVTVIVGSFAKIGKHVESYYDLMAAMDKLGHLFDMPIHRTEGVELPLRKEGLSVAVNDLSGSSPGGIGLKSASLRLLPGEQAALAGGTAQSRSGLLEMLAGLRPPESGHVELDGYDIRRIRLESVLEQVALVRGIEVFAGTIAENLHLGRANVTEEQIRFALADMDLLDELLSLPEGLATPIDTDGRMLSHDQLVRLMLARAVAGQPRLLLVDGVLDGLPDDQLAIVLSNLLAPTSRRTCLIATGRKTVIEACARCVDVSGASDEAAKQHRGSDAMQSQVESSKKDRS